MGTSPTLGTRLWAIARHETSAHDLEAHRDAGRVVYDAQIEIERLRQSYVTSGTDVWGLPPNVQARFLAYWCAYALQKLGEAFLDADYQFDPRTVGFVPSVTAEQVQSFFDGVEPWLRRAGRAEVEPSYQIDVRLPDTLPGWVDVEPCPRAHLEAMFAACIDLIGQAKIAVNDLGLVGADKHRRDLERISSELAAAERSLQYAQSLRPQVQGETVSEELHERMERSLKEALEDAYRAGQWAAMPSLIGQGSEPKRETRHEPTRQPIRLTLPGQRGFNMWCLTDPASRRRWQRDHAAVRAIEMLWQYDPDPEATLAIQAEIDAAEQRGDLERTGQGNYFCCPWSAIYVAINPITLGGRRIRRGQTFTFDVSGEEMAEGGEFKREILVSRFSPTHKVDYCNPEEGGHHDD